MKENRHETVPDTFYPSLLPLLIVTIPALLTLAPAPEILQMSKASRWYAATLRSVMTTSGAILCVAVIGPMGNAEERAPTRADTLLVELAETFLIEIVRPMACFSDEIKPEVIQGDPANARDLDEYVPLFAREFFLYPQSLVKRSKLRRIVLCRRLRGARRSYAGICDRERGTLYLNVRRTSCGWRDYCITVHHEFFHQLDYAHHGIFRRDREWSLLNESGFKYGKIGLDDAGPRSVELTEDHAGFLTPYSLANVQEDKAELFAHLIVDASYVQQRADRDPVLMAKVLTMKRRLIACSPELDETFWQSARRVHRPGKQPMISAGVGTGGN